MISMFTGHDELFKRLNLNYVMDSCMIDFCKYSKDKFEMEISMNEITEEIFYYFLYMQNNIIDLIEEKTKELSMILHNRLPIGEMCDLDIEEYTPGCGYIFVEFEEYTCGESCRDQFDLPIRFLYDSEYPAIFKREFNEKKKLLIEIEEIKVEHEKLKEDVQLEKYELSEYERLRKKYE